jgi:hypothetical protein
VARRVVGQEPPRLLDAIIGHHLEEGFAAAFVDHLRKIRAGEAEFLGQLVQGEIRSAIGLVDLHGVPESCVPLFGLFIRQR